MALKEYRRKRDFKKTPEPAGGRQRSDTGRSFVIQKHAARRLHYDFRLELGGVLKSWAVPKGPSLDPADKRLAMHVEDHPLEYGEFEGIIPRGEYGGGTVMLWDHGEWEPTEDPEKGYRRGKLKFKLHGEKLSGGWSLVRIRSRRDDHDDEKSWLLIKEKDEQAKSAAKYDITEAQPLSVTTGRSLEEIAKQQDRVWHSKRDDVSSKTATKTKARPKASTGRKKSAADPIAEIAGNLPQARKKSLPAQIRPQLASLVKAVPQGDQWLHEMKFDGYRLLCLIENGKPRLITRNGQDWSQRFQKVLEAAAKLPVDNAVLDGEIVVLRKDGTTDFQALQNAIKSDGRANLVYYLFDLPWCEGYDLKRTPLLERKQLLLRILESGDPQKGTLRYSDHIQGEGDTVYEHACRYAMEGIICKRADSPYESKRTQSWVKVKCGKRQEFVIGGYTEPGGARKGFGALLLGYYENNKLRYCGKVGTGFNDKTLKQLHAELQKRERKTSPFDNPPTGSEARKAHWVTPDLVGEVAFTEWTGDGHLRHPSFQGLREDKPAEQVRRESAESTPERRKDAMTKTMNQAKQSVEEQKQENTIAGVTLSNPDRVLWPEQELTKRELAEFYAGIADWVLPFVTHRPLSLVRCPQGHQKHCFFQKHVNETISAPIKSVQVDEQKKKVPYFMIDDLPGLIALVQLGVLEIHPWGSRADKVDKPDMITFDLDPGPGVQWPAIIDGARLLRDRMNELGLQSFVKTSGGKGLHVVVPLVRRSDWDEVKAFAKAVAQSVAEKDPKHYVATMSKTKRQGKIFVDYLRNSRGATAVAAYSTRARSGAPVSTPIDWDELDADLRADAYTIENLPQRLSRLKRDPWQDFFKTRQQITAAMKRELGL